MPLYSMSTTRRRFEVLVTRAPHIFDAISAFRQHVKGLKAHSVLAVVEAPENSRYAAALAQSQSRVIRSIRDASDAEAR